MKGIGGLTKAFKVGLEFTVLETINQAINAQPNVPPIVKTISGLTTSFASYEILSNATKNLPPTIRGIAKVMIEVQSTLTAVQEIPNLIAAIKGFHSSNTGTGGF